MCLHLWIRLESFYFFKRIFFFGKKENNLKKRIKKKKIIKKTMNEPTSKYRSKATEFKVDTKSEPGIYRESKYEVAKASKRIKQKLEQKFGDNKFLKELIPTVSIRPKEIIKEKNGKIESQAESKIGRNELVLKYYRNPSNNNFQWTLYFNPNYPSYPIKLPPDDEEEDQTQEFKLLRNLLGLPETVPLNLVMDFVLTTLRKGTSLQDLYPPKILSDQGRRTYLD